MTTGIKVTVVGGAGMMGQLVGGEMALHGHLVTLYDMDMARLESARRNLFTDMEKLVEKGMLSREEVDECGPRIQLSDNIALAVSNADFVSECVVEREAVKRAVFRDITQHCPRACLVATNSMTMSVTTISAEAEHRERCLGVRFLYPVLLVPDVEFTAGLETSPAALEQAKSLLLSMDKKPFFKAPGSGNHLKLLAQHYEGRQREGAETRRLRTRATGGIHSQSTLADPSSYYLGDGQPLRTNLFPVAPSSSSTVVAPSAPTLPSYSQVVAEDARGGGESADATEVTTGLTTTSSSVPATAAASLSPDSKLCAICLDGPKNGLFFPCGHLCACMRCCEQLQSSSGACPICRASIDKVVRVFET